MRDTVRRGLVGVASLAVALGLSSCDEAPVASPPAISSADTPGAQAPSPEASDPAGSPDEPDSADEPDQPTRPATSVPGEFVAAWSRHSAQFDINADGTGKVVERAYNPCGTSQDCAYHATLVVTPASADTVSITYSKVWFTGDNDAVMTVSAADHKTLDPYFPLAGERATGTVGTDGRLVLTYHGPFAKAGKRSAEANTYCSKSTAPGQSCGA